MYMAGSLSKHNWLRDKIYEHPDILMVPSGQVIAKSKEVALMYKGHVLTIPDIVFTVPDKKYFVEVKSSNNQMLYSKGMRQLEKMIMWHEHHDMKIPETRLVLPRRKVDSNWIDMLEDLETYNIGDSFGHPFNY